jgi:hypothetical protein
VCLPFHYAVTPFVFVLISLAALIIGVKVLMLLGRGVASLLGCCDAETRREDHRSPNPGSGAWLAGMCTSRDCRHLNPPHARYCGRCGRVLSR